jgi:hypothetical protein
MPHGAVAAARPFEVACRQEQHAQLVGVCKTQHKLTHAHLRHAAAAQLPQAPLLWLLGMASQ